MVVEHPKCAVLSKDPKAQLMEIDGKECRQLSGRGNVEEDSN